MARLMINEDTPIEAKVTVSRALVELEDGKKKVVINGVLQSVEYIEEILQIDTPRFSILGVNVIQESFGSEEKEIIYTFTAESLSVINE